jgi:hypothetical protein
MSDIDFGNVALFFSAEDTLLEDASYGGINEQQRQTIDTISSLRGYFSKSYGKANKIYLAPKEELSAPTVDQFFV